VAFEALGQTVQKPCSLWIRGRPGKRPEHGCGIFLAPGADEFEEAVADEVGEQVADLAGGAVVVRDGVPRTDSAAQAGGPWREVW
jgi:hypothetical protein